MEPEIHPPEDESGDNPPVATRTLAVQAFNAAWDLIDRNDRGPDDDASMLVATMASRYLWGLVGGQRESAIGDWQVAHVASLIGHAELALQFAASALATVEANAWTDWLLASALEGMARAAAAAGDTEGRDRYASRSRQVLDTLEEGEDRALIESQLASVPGVGPRS